MNLKSIAALAVTVIASSAWAAAPAEKKCGAGSCSKKEMTGKNAGHAASAASSSASGAHGKEAGCSKKEASCSKKEASCSKKEASCSKK